MWRDSDWKANGIFRPGKKYAQGVRCWKAAGREKKEDMSTQNLIMHVVIPQRNISKNKNGGDNSLQQFIIFIFIVTGSTYLDVFTRQENVIWGNNKTGKTSENCANKYQRDTKRT